MWSDQWLSKDLDYAADVKVIYKHWALHLYYWVLVLSAFNMYDKKDQGNQ